MKLRGLLLSCLFFALSSCKSVPVSTIRQELFLGQVFASAAMHFEVGSKAGATAWFLLSKDGIQILIIAENITPGLYNIYMNEHGDCSALNSSPGRSHNRDFGNIIIGDKGIGILNLGIPASQETQSAWKGIIGRKLVMTRAHGDSSTPISCGYIEADY